MFILFIIPSTKKQKISVLQNLKKKEYTLQESKRHIT